MFDGYSRGVPTVNADLAAERDLLNRNVDEMIRLCQCATDAGLWTQQEAQRHTARLESLRAKWNADFEELAALHERLREARERTRKESPAVMPER
jgi:hypothetical protein